ncbi:MAG: 50S ribosomal protein L11 methyltransferase [Candidatus Spyradenecus sp.]
MTGWILATLGLVAGLALLTKSADWFIEGAVALARRLGLSPLIIGFVIVGFGTSAPEMLVSALAAGDLSRPVLDMGCGSGILAIAARKLGFSHVRGFDYDPDAVTVARENAQLNGLDIPFETRDLAANLDQGAVVLANILGPVLIEYAAEVACAVQPGGALIASGILDELYPQVRAAFEAHGLHEVRNLLIGEWRSGLFTNPQENT